MKVSEGMIYAFVQEPPKKKRKKRLRKGVSFWKLAVALAVVSVGIGYYGGYEPQKPLRPALQYRVAEGDTLWDIASMYGEDGVDIRETYWQIAEDNNVPHNGVLRPGQILKIRR